MARYHKDPEFRERVIKWSTEARERQKLKKLFGILSELPFRVFQVRDRKKDPFIFPF